jgi:hypothetical protein
MEEFESQSEHVEEHLHHHAEHTQERWVMGVALTAALLAALAAITGLLAGGRANEAMLLRIKCASDWNYYQSISIKSGQLQSKMEAYELQGKKAKESDKEKLHKYEKQHEQVAERANEEDGESTAAFHSHEVLARGVTMFQVAIAVSAIAALTRRREFWFVGIGLGCAGVFFLVAGLLPGYAPAHAPAPAPTHAPATAPATATE